MKRIVFTIIFTLMSIVSSIAQNNVPNAQQKQTINPLIDKSFELWSADWSYDTYVIRSAKINSIHVDEDYGDVKVIGIFDYKRLVGTQSGTFSATLTTTDGYLKVVKISYVDQGGVRGSKTFD